MGGRSISLNNEDGPRDALGGMSNFKEKRAAITTFLERRAPHLRTSDVWENPAALPGTWLYKRFAEAHAESTRRALDASNPPPDILLCFHGTREENVEAICCNGLDPARRGQHVGQMYGAGEYFAEEPSISVPYCAGGAPSHDYTRTTFICSR